MNLSNRQSNFELLRLLAMFLVLLVHANYLSLGIINQHDISLSPFTSFLRIFLQQICIVCVNLFVLISGWFGIRPSSKGFISLLFQIYFYTLLFLIIANIFQYNIDLTSVIKCFYWGSWYWFIPEYLLLYVLSPLINSFVSNSNSKEIATSLIFFFLLEFCLGWIVDYATFNYGNSAISFIGLYLLGRFMNDRSLLFCKKNIKVYLILYCVFTIFPVLIAFLGLKTIGLSFSAAVYSSPFVIISSVSLFLAFSKIRLQSYIINWVSISAFSIYLIHLNPIVQPYFIKSIQLLYNNLNFLVFIMAVFVYSIFISLICILLDKFRIFVWNFIWNNILFKIDKILSEQFEIVINKILK